MYKYIEETNSFIDENNPNYEGLEGAEMTLEELEAFRRSLIPLEEVKSAKIEEIKAARDAAEQAGFDYLGKTFDSDSVSVQRLSCAAQTALLAKTTGQPFLITWTCKDNSTVDLDADGMIGTIPALAAHSNALHSKAAALKELVGSAADAEEVSAIAWED